LASEGCQEKADIGLSVLGRRCCPSAVALSSDCGLSLDYTGIHALASWASWQITGASESLISGGAGTVINYREKKIFGHTFCFFLF
jgi:hypothetical protein